MRFDRQRTYRSCILVSLVGTVSILLRFGLYGIYGSPGYFYDSIFFLGLAGSIVALISAAMLVNGSMETGFLLASTTFLAITIRMIPCLGLAYPPFDDPYFYVAGPMNISQYGTIHPEMNQWFLGLDFELKWPSLHILSASIMDVSGQDSMFVLRNISPLLSVVYVLALYLIARNITGNIKIAAMAAVVGGLLDSVIFYQSEYHPQGLAISLFFLSLSFLIRSTRPTVTIRAVFFLLVVSVFMTHHFTSYFFTTLGLMMIPLWVFIERFTRSTSSVTNRSRGQLHFWAAVVLIGLAYNSFVRFEAAPSFLYLLTVVNPGSQLVTVGEGVPILYSFLGTYKWILLVLATPFILECLTKRTPKEMGMTAIVLVILVVVGVGNFLSGGPVDRMLAFAFPLIVILSIQTLWKWISHSPRRRAVSPLKSVIAVGLLAVVSLMSSLNAQIPAIYFESSPQNDFYWYANDMQSVSRYDSAGSWIELHAYQYGVYTTEFDTVVVPYFYGKIPLGNIRSIRDSNGPFDGLTILNPSIPHKYPDGSIIDKEVLHQSTNVFVVYDDGALWMMLSE